MTKETERDYNEEEIKELQELGEWMLLMLHVALERPTNKEWLEQYKLKNEKKWKQLSKE